MKNQALNFGMKFILAGLAVAFAAQITVTLTDPRFGEHIGQIAPAFGVAVAIVLLGGYRFLPAIFIGGLLPSVFVEEAYPVVLSMPFALTSTAAFPLWAPRFLKVDFKMERAFVFEVTDQSNEEFHKLSLRHEWLLNDQVTGFIDSPNYQNAPLEDCFSGWYQKLVESVCIRFGNRGAASMEDPLQNTSGVTAYAMNEEREKFLEAGMNDDIRKPVEVVELRKRSDVRRRRPGAHESWAKRWTHGQS